MKAKLLLIFALIPVVLGAQILEYKAENSRHTGGQFFVNGVASERELTWSELMLVDYVATYDYITFTQTQKDSILARLSEDYVVNTFGPEGLNKSVCDFLIYMETSNTTTNMTAKGFRKNGDLIRWNYGNGDIFLQDEIPAYTCSTGVLSGTADDGMYKINRWLIDRNNITHSSGAHYVEDMSRLFYYQNDVPDEIRVPNSSGLSLLYGYSNVITSLVDYIQPSVTVFSFKLCPITSVGTLSFSQGVTLIDLSYCSLPSSEVNEVFADVDGFITTPTADLTINTSNGSNEALPGGATNTFLLSLSSKYTAVSKLLTAIYTAP